MASSQNDLIDKRVAEILKFFQEYKLASNAATGAKYDQNANVTSKNIATMQAESIKKLGIDVQRAMAYNYIQKRYGEDLANQYVADLTTHIIYTNDESTLGGYPYCAAISLYPFLLNGLKELGGSSGPPQHANGYIGGLINLLFLVAGQFAGAVAIPEFLPYFDHFLRKDFGDDYINHLDENNGELRHRLEDWMQQFVYSINQPAGSRNYQSPFTNIAYFDRYYFDSLFKDFIFPDGDEPCWETTKELQKIFMKWFNKERTKEVLTFPVETANCLWDPETYQFKDEDSCNFFAEMWAEGHSFFMYNSDSADALSSCCFDKDQEVLLYIDGNMKYDTFEHLYDLQLQRHSTDVKAHSRGKLRDCRIIRLPNRPMYHIRVAQNKELTVSDNHLHATLRGDVPTIQLTTSDFLLLDALAYAIEDDNHSVSVTRWDHVREVYDLNKECKIIDDQVYIKVQAIEPIEYHDDIYCLEMSDASYPYFTLPNGIITHNCRLKNAIETNEFSYTLGAGGVRTGSKRVITLNFNRIVQNWYREGHAIPLSEYITPIVERVHKYLIAWNDKLWDDYNAGILTVFSAGYISLDDQYLTCGFNGWLECAEFLAAQPDTEYAGLKIKHDNPQYKQLAIDLLETMKKINAEDRTEHCKFNTEMIPAESVGVKHYKWDKEDGYWVPQNRNCYNSYFYPVEDASYDPVEKIYLHGTDFIGCLDGGSALHCNLEEHLSQKQYRLLMDIAAKAGCSYFTFNIPNTICNDCGNIDKRMLHKCPKCGSTHLDYATRIIGYLKRVSNFSEARQVEAKKRFYGNLEG